MSDTNDFNSLHTIDTAKGHASFLPLACGFVCVRFTLLTQSAQLSLELRTNFTMSDMETEPPDGTPRPKKTSLPKSNDEPMPEYGRMNPFEPCNSIESRLRQQSPELNQQRDRKTAQGNDKRRKQKEPKKKAADTPPDETDNDKCRHHKEIQKFVKMLNGRLSFLEHCNKSEKEFPDLADDDALVEYLKDHDELSSLKEHKLGELALILPCPVLDCPENTKNSINLNDPPETNAKKHSRQASRDSEKIANPNTEGGFTSPQKVAKKLKLSDPIAGTSQPISVKNKFSSLAGKEANVTPPISNQTTAPIAARPKVPPIMFKHKKENFKTIIKDLNKDFPNCDVKLAGKYLEIFTTSTNEHRIVTLYRKEKCEEFYVINPPDSRPLKIVIKGLPVSTEFGEIKTDLTSQGFRVVKVAQLTRSKTKSRSPFLWSSSNGTQTPQISSN
ncbi:nucleic-acid-binding protein from transposon X-element [Trichonephila clavipes]|nr:nucleic-acid-binding protein from transposon X-element [Trichonephila clavipes]